MRNFVVTLFKDSNCDNCKLMQEELLDNPPNAEIRIVHVRYENGKYRAKLENIKVYPTIILFDNENEITRLTGFVSSKTIDEIFDRYEAEYLV